jgi:hypothetical protein
MPPPTSTNTDENGVLTVSQRHEDGSHEENGSHLRPELRVIPWRFTKAS